MAPVFNPLLLSAVAMDVLASSRADIRSLAARQRIRLAKLLQVAGRDSPLYKERLKYSENDEVNLENLPRISKTELMERFDEWVTDRNIKLKDLRAFTANPDCIAKSFLDRYLVWESSGTSHQPCIFVQDAHTMAVYDALEALRRSTPRHVKRGLDPMMLTERIAYIGVDGGHYASIVSTKRLQQLNPFMANTLRNFSIMQHTAGLIEELNAFAPTIIATYPTVATLLADEAHRGTLRFIPKEIWTGGETLSAVAKQHLKNKLGAEVRDSYGASEFISIGWECDHGRMHANSDWVILEPVDEHARPAPLGSPSYSTLLTNLANHVQPLIRYDMGDRVIVHPSNCHCGSTLPVIEVQGRCDDILVMLGQDGNPVSLLPMALSTTIEEVAGIFDFQLCQKNDHTLLLILGPGEEETATALQRCRQAVDHFGQIHALAPVSVEFETGKPFQRGRSGKALRIIGLPTPVNNVQITNLGDLVER